MTGQDPVSRLNTALEGRYAIERELGEGGMATVYLAKDLKHNRNVALKVLKPELAAVVGAERFLAEIETTANLTHPHILPLFDSGEADSFLFYVMPHIEGESLRERIDREKQLAVQESLAITQKVASALDYAHGNGVVHRDIKPGNILLSEQGEPLVADFGIALAVAQAGAGRITETGLSLGTPHYMSPEQATGDRDVDPRSDVYALGCVLYEMLAGDPPFSASTAQAVLVQILTADAPSITTARRTVPAHVSAALAQALEKLPADRFTSAAEFGAALTDPSFTYEARTRTSVTASTPEPVATLTMVPGPWKRLTVAFATTAALLAALAAWGWLRPSPEPGVPLRTGLTGMEIVAGAGVRLAISRDGSQIVVSSTAEGVSKLFIRDADQVEFREIPGTDGANYPVFSPAGQWLAFHAGGEIYRVETSGGPVLPVATGTHPHWGLDDLIVFDEGGGISSVAPGGGEPTLILSAPGNSRPHLLPDGEAIIFQGTGGEGRTLMVVEIVSGVVTDLGLSSANNPIYISTGHVVYGHGDQALMAVPFDLSTHRTTGEPATVLPEVLVYGGGATQFTVSETGTAVYALPRGGARASAQLVIVDAGGVETPLAVGGGSFRHPRFSPTGRQIVYKGANETFVYDLDTGENRSLAADESRLPWWSRDGRYVYFGDMSGGGFRRLADGSEEAEQLYRRDGLIPLSMSLDGTQVLVMELTTDRGWDLVIMSEDGDSVGFTDYLRADWNETMATISPDGNRAAYASDELASPRSTSARSRTLGTECWSPTAAGPNPFGHPTGRRSIPERQQRDEGVDHARRSVLGGYARGDVPGGLESRPRWPPPDELGCAPGRRVVPVREPAGSRTHRGGRRTRHARRTGRELVRGASPADGELNRQVPWLRVFVEGVVIVASILMAFGIQAWWDGRQEAAEREELREALRGDFEETLRHISESIETAQGNLAKTEAFLEAVGSGAAVLVDSLQVLIAATFRAPFWEPQLALYEGAISSGDLALVQSPRLMDALAYFELGRSNLENHLDVLFDLQYSGANWELRRELGSLAPLARPAEDVPAGLRIPEGELLTILKSTLVYAAVEVHRNAMVNVIRGLDSMEIGADEVLEALNVR